MKFAMNGALTIGTLDGANIEIREEVGAENFFLFGLDGARGRRAEGARVTGPMDYVERNAELRAVIDLIRDGFFSRGDTSLFRPLVDNLVWHDPYLVLADYPVVRRVPDAGRPEPIATRSAGRACRSSTPRARASSRPTARSASTATDIWQAKPVPVRLLSQEEVKAGLLQ